MKFDSKANWQEHPIKITFKSDQEGNRHNLLCVKNLITLEADRIFVDSTDKSRGIELAKDFPAGFKLKGFMFAPVFLDDDYNDEIKVRLERKTVRKGMWESSVAGILTGSKTIGSIASDDYNHGFSTYFGQDEFVEIGAFTTFSFIVEHKQPITCSYRGLFWGNLRRPIQ